LSGTNKNLKKKFETHFFGSRPVVGGREREEKKTRVWPDFVCWSGRKSRARVVEKNFGAKQAKGPVLVEQGERRKSKKS
jgi:hypothetical protein